jgi:hypothetical protein
MSWFPAFVAFLVWLSLTGGVDAAPPPSEDSPSTPPARSRLLLGLGGASTGIATSISGRYESWNGSLLGWGGVVGGVLADGSSRGASRALFVGPSLSLRSSNERGYWLLSTALGGGYSEYHDVWCTEDFSWNEGSCTHTDREGFGPYGGLLIGRTGGRKDPELGVFLSLDYVWPELAYAALNVGWGW